MTLRSRRSRKKNTRCLGRECGTREETDEHCSTVNNNDNDREQRAPLKAQGLPYTLSLLKYIGVCLEEDGVSHGQTYVGFSRRGGDENLWVVSGPEPGEDGKVWIKNVMPQEVLLDV
jgi:hypothetical protein